MNIHHKRAVREVDPAAGAYPRSAEKTERVVPRRPFLRARSGRLYLAQARLQEDQNGVKYACGTTSGPGMTFIRGVLIAETVGARELCRANLRQAFFSDARNLGSIL